MSSSPELELLRCSGCGATVALVPAAEVACARCGAEVEIPERHAQALQAANEGHEARQGAAQRLVRLAQQPQTGMQWIAALAIILLPSLVTYLVAQRPELGWAQIELTVYVALPATLPGVWLYLWAAASSSTGARFCDALSAVPTPQSDGQLSCRNCAAPLGAPDKNHVICCPYCRSDNLLRNVELGELQESLRSSLRTLAQANRMVRMRGAIWGLGVGVACGLVLGFIALVHVVVG